MDAKTGFAIVTMGMLAVSPAAAQLKLAQVTPVPAPDSKKVIPERQGPSVQTGRSDSLSKSLSESGGVIKPSGDVDPGMKVPTPESGRSMPVIPPAATGGDSAK